MLLGYVSTRSLSIFTFADLPPRFFVPFPSKLENIVGKGKREQRESRVNSDDIRNIRGKRELEGSPGKEFVAITKIAIKIAIGLARASNESRHPLDFTCLISLELHRLGNVVSRVPRYFSAAFLQPRMRRAL